MNEKQLLILKELAKNGHYVTVTNLLQSLSRKTGIALSTLRWNVKKLKRLGLIQCGDKNNKGVPAKLTKKALLILGGDKMMEKELKELLRYEKKVDEWYKRIITEEDIKLGAPPYCC